MLTMLQGTAASPGVVEGRVKIVHEHDNRHDFEEGTILVTIMTEPSMVVMMNRAAAIVTDVGGLMCHAAIVSRELGVPCVVATKRATQVLKDGWHVRVDGGEGTVTVLAEV